MAPSLDVVQGVYELFVDALLIGLYIPTLFLTIKCLTWDSTRSSFKSSGKIHWLMLLSVIVLCLASTLSFALGILRSVEIFEKTAVPNWIGVAKSTTTYLALSVGNSILIYRCWIVWGKNYRICVLPALLWATNTSCAIVLLWIQATIANNSLVNIGKQTPFLRAYTAVNIPFTWLLTSCIVFRIWRVDRENAKFKVASRYGLSTLQSVMRIVIESGLIVAATDILSFATYFTNSNIFYVATAIQVRGSAIAFNLIIIRAHNKSKDEYTLPIVSRSMHFNHDTTADPIGIDVSTTGGRIIEENEKTETKSRLQFFSVKSQDDSLRG